MSWSNGVQSVMESLFHSGHVNPAVEVTPQEAVHYTAFFITPKLVLAFLGLR